MTKSKVCPGWGSNSRPSDYETDALPTALPRLYSFTLKKCDTHGGTRTPNLRFRRPTPYPLGHAGLWVWNLLQAVPELVLCNTCAKLPRTKGHIRLLSFCRLQPISYTWARVAQWIRRRSPKPKIGGSSPPMGTLPVLPSFLELPA